MSSHAKQVLHLLDMSPAYILMYTRDIGQRFRVPGTNEEVLASVENRKLHERSSDSNDSWQLSDETGLSCAQKKNVPYDITNGLSDLN